jgi:hypothetical protein
MNLLNLEQTLDDMNDVAYYYTIISTSLVIPPVLIICKIQDQDLSGFSNSIAKKVRVD